MKKQFIFFALATIVLLLTGLFLPEAVFAQSPLPPPPSQNPIDGGLALLAATGGGYAIKKLRDRKV